MQQKTKSILYRFLRGAGSSAIATMVIVVGTAPSDWGDLSIWLQKLLFSGIIGFIAGLILSIDKYFRLQVEQPCQNNQNNTNMIIDETPVDTPTEEIPVDNTPTGEDEE